MKTKLYKKYIKTLKKMIRKSRERSYNYEMRITSGSPEEVFFKILEYRQKSHGYKKQNYCDNYYYITKSGELGCIKNKGHNTGKMLGELLERRKVINKKTHEASVEINGGKDTFGIKGVIIKHNRVLDDLRTTLTEKQLDYLSKLFDSTETCDMVIDRDFKKAYEPSYRDPAVYGGDLCSSQSCMSCRGEGAQQFYGAIPCCSVVRFQKGDEQVGRCIMYAFNGKRHFIRIYGKPEYLPKMYRLLQKEKGKDDLFGRSYYIPELKQETSVTDETTNMYLDGSNYGFVRSADENGENVKYTMVTCDTRKEVDGEYNNMKSTSDNTVKRNFRCRSGDADWVCECCGTDIYEDDDDAVWIDDLVFCSYDCAHEYGWYECDKCGEWGNTDGDGFWIDDQFYCCVECANRDGYWYCEGCGKWEYEDYMYDVSGEGSICEECRDELVNSGMVVECDYCGDWIRKEDAHKVIKKETREEVWLDEYCHDCHMDRYDEIKEGDDVDEE